MLGVDKAVIGGVGLVKHWETIGMVLPWKVATIHNGPAEGSAVSTKKFCQRMHDDVRAIFNGTEKDGRSNRIVNDQRHSMFVRHERQLFDVTYVPRGITDTFAENCARLVIDQLFQCAWTIRLCEANADS